MGCLLLLSMTFLELLSSGSFRLQTLLPECTSNLSAAAFYPALEELEYWNTKVFPNPRALSAVS